MRLLINRKLQLLRVKDPINIKDSHWNSQFILNIDLNNLALCY